MTCARSKYSWDVVVQVCVGRISPHALHVQVCTHSPLLLYSDMLLFSNDFQIWRCSSQDQVYLPFSSSTVQLYVLLTLQRVDNLLFFDKRDDSQFGEHVHVHTVVTNNVSAVLSRNCNFYFFCWVFLGFPSLLSSYIFPSSPSLLHSLNYPFPFSSLSYSPSIFPYSLSIFSYSPSIFPSSDFLTVSETAKEPPQDETGINCPTSLAMEATYINQNFSQQMLVVSLSVCLSVFYQSVWCLSDCLSVYLSIFWL